MIVYWAAAAATLGAFGGALFLAGWLLGGSLEGLALKVAGGLSVSLAALIGLITWAAS